MHSDDGVLAYLAGFFDGEGSVSVSRDVLRVSIGQLDDRPLLMFKEKWGGNVSLVERQSPHRNIHHWTITSGKAAAVLEELLPYLLVKRDVALVGISFQMLRHADRARVTEEEHSQRKVIADTIRFLNRERTYA